jgi:hypothetical protein
MTPTLRRLILFLLPLMVAMSVAGHHVWARPVSLRDEYTALLTTTPTPVATAQQQYLPVIMANGKPTTTPERTLPTKTVLPVATPTLIPTATGAPTATPTPVNQPPTVDADGQQLVTWPTPAVLTGTVSDDGLPSGQLTVTWSKADGPGEVTFVPVDQLSTTVSFAQPGAYVLAFAADDSEYVRKAHIEILVNGTPPVPATDVQVTAVSSSTLTITWTDNATNEDGYLVDEGDMEFTLPADSTTFSHDGLPPADYHCYRVIAFNAYGRSVPTPWLCGETLPVPIRFLSETNLP